MHSSGVGLLKYKPWFDSHMHTCRYSYTSIETIMYRHTGTHIDRHIKRINTGGKVRMNFIFTTRQENAELPRLKRGTVLI